MSIKVIDRCQSQNILISHISDDKPFNDVSTTVRLTDITYQARLLGLSPSESDLQSPTDKQTNVTTV